MTKKIAMGFHTCVDYELIWNTDTVESMIRAFEIREDELRLDGAVHTQRDAWIFCLAHLRAGVGGEIVPDEPQSVIDFAEHFDRNVTLGGTATRAAIALDKLGYDTVLQTSCWNPYVEELLPARVKAVPGTVDDGMLYPHVVLQCAKGVRIHANDIDFVTPRENRICRQNRGRRQKPCGKMKILKILSWERKISLWWRSNLTKRTKTETGAGEKA